jgi:hypothetical protein
MLALNSITQYGTRTLKTPTEICEILHVAKTAPGGDGIIIRTGRPDSSGSANDLDCEDYRDDHTARAITVLVGFRPSQPGFLRAQYR